jgi:hypothetical protein
MRDTLRRSRQPFAAIILDPLLQLLGFVAYVAGAGDRELGKDGHDRR